MSAVIAVPYHLDEYLPGLDVPLEIGHDVWDRLAMLYGAVADAVAGVASRDERPVVLSGDCTTALATVAGLQRAGGPGRHRPGATPWAAVPGARRPDGGVDGLAEYRGRPRLQRLVQPVDQPVHGAGSHVHEAGQAQQRDQGREEREEPVIGQAAGRHAAAVPHELHHPQA
ncbi:MAG TPA: hypothetical protein VMC83_11465 [Streptosporangiaceae bacterium]|nr:hypothetical protein [Streptosporangiaceae bacterium]